MKLFNYINHLGYRLTPSFIYEQKKKALEQRFASEAELVKDRVDYYLKLTEPFELPSNSVEVGQFKRKGFTAYYLDLKEYLYYFPKHYRLRYYFGDETHIEPAPTLFKARPIDGCNERSVLFKMDKLRHFRFVDDKRSFREKKDMAVFRGAVTQPHRIEFMQRMFSHPLIDAGQSNASCEHPQWQKPFMSVAEQLKYKFLICLEGNDVASNLKWAMSSNSVVITPKMKFETWFMEGRLQAGIHYIEVKDDFSDMEEKINFYLAHPDEAERIIENAHDYIAPFKNHALEDHVCIKTLEKYFKLSGQRI